ncbi:hypothetical protein ABBQ38_007735 [Trebouxia sp. C0009 RCD-2024]
MSTAQPMMNVPEVVGKAPELLQSGSVFGDWPILHNGNFLGVHAQTLGANNVAQKVQLRLPFFFLTDSTGWPYGLLLGCAGLYVTFRKQ